MEIAGTTSALASVSGTSQDSEVPSRSVISSDFETFLKMLTAQMNNQDPLNPLDSQDFATQLATFSGVEQQVKTNDLLTALGQQIGVSGLADMAGWVGMEARIKAPVAFTGAPVELLPDLPTLADRAELVVRDRSGNEVQRFAIPVRNDPFLWAGTRENGAPLPDGTYEVSIVAYATDDAIGEHIPERYAQVSEVRTAEGGTVVVLSDGSFLPATSVSGLRQPSS